MIAGRDFYGRWVPTTLAITVIAFMAFVLAGSC